MRDFFVGRLKLICSGKVLKDNLSLESQGVKNGQQIMAIVLVETPDQVVDRENQIKELESTKTDSRLLALDDEYMQVKSSLFWTLLYNIVPICLIVHKVCFLHNYFQ